MPGGYFTTDHVDLNTVYYKTLMPSLTRYNQFDFFPFREYLCSDGDESYVKYPVSKLQFQKLGEAEKPNAQKLEWARFKATTSKTGIAFGYTFDFLKDAKVQDIDDTQAMIYQADRLGMQNAILNCALDGASVAGFWNGYFDNETTDPRAYASLGKPPDYGQNRFSADHSHYKALNSTSIVLTTFTDAKQHLAEHGHQGPYACFINSNDIQTLEDLAGWSGGAYVSNPIVSQTAIDGFQKRWLGFDFYATEAIPSGYLLIIDLGIGSGPQASPAPSYAKPIKFIEASNPSFRGLIMKQGSTDREYPIIDSYYLRWMGAKVWARGAGYVIQAKTGSTFTAPTLI